MTQVDLIRILQGLARDNDKRVFSLNEISRLAAISRPAAGMLLLRAEKKGIVRRATNCWVNFLDPPELLEIALALVSPSYLSFESALYRHGILSQSPRGGMTLATTGRPCRMETPLGIVRFIHLKPGLFFGYDAGRIAVPEKAWLDLLYIRGRQGRREIVSEEFYRDRLNRKRLRLLENKFPGWVQEASRAILRKETAI